MLRASNSGQLSLFDEPPLPQPGECEFEARWIYFGKKPKSECLFRGSVIWVNCRDWGRCIWDGWWQRGSGDGLTFDEDGGGE